MELVDRASRALGEIVIDERDEKGLPSAAHCAPTPLGRRVLDCWFQIERFHPECKVLVEQLMPEHFHGIIRVMERLKAPLGMVINGFKVGCNRAARELRPDILLPGALPPETKPPTSASTSALPPTSASPGALPPTSATAKPATKHHGAGGGMWQEGYCDKPVLRRGQLQNQFEYIKSNPLRRAIKAAAPELFRKYRDLEIKGMHFEALGNHWLLDRPLHQLQCSRDWCKFERVKDRAGKLIPSRDKSGNFKIAVSSPEFAERLEAMQIAGEESSKKDLTRLDGVALNRVAQLIAGDGAVEINYKGIVPERVDEYVAEITWGVGK